MDGGARLCHHVFMCLRRGLLVLSLSWLLATQALSPGRARADAPTSKPKIEFSWDGRFFFDDLPHGKPFLISTDIARGLTFKQGVVWKSGKKKCEQPDEGVQTLPFDVDDTEAGKTVTLSVPALKYATAYCFRFTATEGLTSEQVGAIGAAVESMVKAISARQLYTADTRATFLTQELGKLARQSMIIDEQPTTVIDWVTGWTESDARFVELWQQYGEREQAMRRVSDQADHLRTLDLADAQLVFAAMPSALASALKSHADVRADIERGNFSRAVTDHIAKTSPPTLGAEANALRESARTVREQAESARRQVCSGRASSSSSMADLAVEIERLQRDIVSLEAQGSGTAGTEPKGRKERAARAQREARLQASKQALIERRTDRLCKNLLNLQAYADRLADALTDELQAAIVISQKSHAIGDVISARKAAIPVEVVHGTRSADPTYTERATGYISADVGAIFPRFSAGNWGASLFVGVNFSLSPVDKDVPLSQDGGFGKRFSFIAGLTITEFRDNAETVTGIAGGQAAVLGVGYRVTDYIRLGAGGVLFRQTHPNPAIDSKSLKVAPYFALSVDSDVGGLIKNLLTKSKNSVP